MRSKIDGIAKSCFATKVNWSVCSKCTDKIENTIASLYAYHFVRANNGIFSTNRNSLRPSTPKVHYTFGICHTQFTEFPLSELCTHWNVPFTNYKHTRNGIENIRLDCRTIREPSKEWKHLQPSPLEPSVSVRITRKSIHFPLKSPAHSYKLQSFCPSNIGVVVLPLLLPAKFSRTFYFCVAFRFPRHPSVAIQFDMNLFNCLLSGTQIKCLAERISM